jgi:hypothetical protein
MKKWVLVLIMLWGPASPAADRDVIAGAIRWDAWHGDRSEVGKAVQRSLGPKQWHYRLPFFARVLDDSHVQIDGVTQAIVDQEIRYARSADLDYWAFLLYDESSAMSLPLKSYLSSTHKRGLRFCAMAEFSRLKTAEEAQRIVRLMSRPEYQTVAGGRPLLYLIDSESEPSHDLQPALGILRGRNPYIVILDWRPARSNAFRISAHADAIGAYSFQRDGRGATFVQLAHEAEQFWDECRETGSQVVPVVMTGWDRRPRVDRPVFWETWQQPGVGIEKFYAAPTAAELAQHLARSVAWIRAHPDAAPSKAMLIYAWNENDEGGWLVPTVGDGTSRLRAVRNGLRGR